MKDFFRKLVGRYISSSYHGLGLVKSRYKYLVFIVFLAIPVIFFQWSKLNKNSNSIVQKNDREVSCMIGNLVDIATELNGYYVESRSQANSANFAFLRAIKFTRLNAFLGRMAKEFQDFGLQGIQENLTRLNQNLEKQIVLLTKDTGSVQDLIQLSTVMEQFEGIYEDLSFQVTSSLPYYIDALDHHQKDIHKRRLLKGCSREVVGNIYEFISVWDNQGPAAAWDMNFSQGSWLPITLYASLNDLLGKK